MNDGRPLSNRSVGSSNPLRTKTGKTAVGESVSHNDRVETAGVLTLESLQRQRVVSVAERWVVMSRARALSLLFLFVCMHACMHVPRCIHTHVLDTQVFLRPCRSGDGRAQNQSRREGAPQDCAHQTTGRDPGLPMKGPPQSACPWYTPGWTWSRINVQV